MSTLKPHWIPRLVGDSPDAMKEFIRSIIDPTNSFRRWHMLRKARNIWFYRGRHWIMEAREVRGDGAGGYKFAEIVPWGGAHDRILPVTNIIGSTVDNEVSRLGRRELVASVTADQQTPEMLAAARLAKNVNAANLKTADWPEVRERHDWDLVVGGDATYKTWWDETLEDTIRLAQPNAAKCSVCDTVLADTKVPLGMQDKLRHAEHASLSSGPAGQTLDLAFCPTCEQPTALQPYNVSPEEAEDGVDIFERPMGLDHPRGVGAHEIVSAFDLFPMGGGAGVEPGTCGVTGQRAVRSLDYIASRIPEWAGKLMPETSKELMKQHPTLGESGFTGAGSGVSSEKVYPDHAFFEEVHVDPLPVEGLDMGMSFVRCGQLVLARPLCVEMEGPDGEKHKIKRVQYQTSRFKRIPGEYWGRTVVDDLVPLNRKLNMLDFQVECIRDGGIPQVWLPTDVELHSRESDEGGAWRTMEYEGAPQDWNPKNSILNGQPMSGNAYMDERNGILADMQKVGGASDVELGLPPGGSAEMNTSYLMTLNEESAQKRGSRERSRQNTFEKGWKHDLELTWAFRKEDQTYEVLTKADSYERKSFKGADILGQVGITIQKQVGYDNALFRKTAVQEGVDRGSIKLDSQAAIDRFNEATGVPKDINEEGSIQVNRAESTWSEFMKDRTVPIPDEAMHDPWVRYQVYGKRWEGDECVLARDAVQFDQLILPAIAGWQQELARIDMEEAATRPIYGKQPQATWEAIYQKGAMLTAQVKKASQPQMGPLGPVGVPGPPVPEFPKPPMQPFLPQELSARIFAVWQSMLPQLQAPPVPLPVESSQKPMELLAFLKMRAVIEAYKMIAENKKAQQGALAAPGGAATPAGTEPVPGAPVMPAPGGGAAPGGAM